MTFTVKTNQHTLKSLNKFPNVVVDIFSETGDDPSTCTYVMQIMLHLPGKPPTILEDGRYPGKQYMLVTTKDTAHRKNLIPLIPHVCDRARKAFEQFYGAREYMLTLNFVMRPNYTAVIERSTPNEERADHDYTF